MPHGPTQKRMCNPCGIPDAKYFAERKRRRKAERTEPLPGTKQTVSSEDDGQLEQLFTAHDSTTIPKPVGGRKLLHEKDDEQLQRIAETQSRKTVSSPKAVTMGWVAIALSVVLLGMVFSTAFIKIPEFLLIVGFLGFIAMHACALYSQLNSDSKCGLGILGLAIFYPGYVIWCLIGGLL